MRILVIIAVFMLAACGRESSPEGRSQLRIEKLQLSIDSLKQQNKNLSDSLASLSRSIRELKTYQ